MADNGGISTTVKKRRNIPRREWAKREIHRLIVSEGLSGKEVCAILNIPPRTYERWLNEIYHTDNLVLLTPTIDDVMTSASIYKDRLTKQRRDVLAMANDPKIDAVDRLQAHNLAAEIDKAIYMLSYETPMTVIRNINISNTKKIVEQQGLNLKLLKDQNSQPMTIRYEPQQQQQKKEEEAAAGS